MTLKRNKKKLAAPEDIQDMDQITRVSFQQSFQVLLDSGSQQTYISKGITDKLKLTPIEKNFLRFTDLEQESRNASKHQLWKLQWY